MSTEYTFKSWEEMSTLEQYAEIFWDMYKSAHGIRPRWIDTSNWTEAQFEEEFKSLGHVIEENQIREEASQKASVAKFEAQVDLTIASGAGDRATALRWIFDAEELDSTVRFDQEHFEYLHNLPWGYFNKVAQ